MYRPKRVGLRGQPCFRPLGASWKQGRRPADVRTDMGTSSCHACTARSHPLGAEHKRRLRRAVLAPEAVLVRRTVAAGSRAHVMAD